MSWILYFKSLGIGEQIAICALGLGVLTLAITILFHFAKNRYYKKSKIKKYYNVVWKKASKLTPQQVMYLRGKESYGFKEYYYSRAELDKAIQDHIENNKNVLVIGNPLAGKTRLVYQNLKKLKNAEILIPRDVDYSMEDFLIPRSFTPWRKKILLLDDLNKYTDNQNYIHMLQEFSNENILIIATCRIGPELDSVESKLEQYMSSLFANRLQIQEIDKGLAEKIASEAQTRLPNTFDSNIGSIFLQLDAMIKRYKACPEQQKGILRSIKRLYLAGITEERETFTLARVKKVCTDIEELDFKEHEWMKHLGLLKKNGLIDYGENGIEIEETYMFNVIDAEYDTLTNMQQMFDIFKDDPDALFNIGGHSLEFEDKYTDIMEYAVICINVYNKVLEKWTLLNNPEKYALTRNNLGNALSNLAEIKNKKKNCQWAIESYQKALSVKIFNRNSMYYALAQNNLSNAYRMLAEIENTANNCKLAIESCQEALKIYTFERYPKDNGMAQHNLGTALSKLAEVENKASNCKLAIESYQEALKVRTFERFPIDYAMTHNNLGVAYQTLAEEKDKLKNFRLAIKSYQEALKVRTFERFPIDYATTYNNLGVVYSLLAEAKDNTVDCQLAIESFKKALKVNTIDRFPIDYALTQSNLGGAYIALANIENVVINCQLSIACSEEALQIYKFEHYPMDYAGTQLNLGIAFGILATDSNRESNCRQARKCFNDALACIIKLDFTHQVKMVESAFLWLDEICQGDQG
ncbi:MAG: tetratricopeptide repeat protein [candidate division Zixibacteria bacterium]|nr:tetratricopeptide repeat protein [candidate division Zixibacteria bacterium]